MYGLTESGAVSSVVKSKVDTTSLGSGRKYSLVWLLGSSTKSTRRSGSFLLTAILSNQRLRVSRLSGIGACGNPGLQSDFVVEVTEHHQVFAVYIFKPSIHVICVWFKIHRSPTVIGEFEILGQPATIRPGPLLLNIPRQAHQKRQNRPMPLRLFRGIHNRGPINIRK